MLLMFCLAYAAAWGILIWLNGKLYLILVLIAFPLMLLLWEWDIMAKLRIS
ncbi:MAG: hypothetical protein GXO66_00360 [Euryarchaeota archaeon]|nr:hypothetical protein [Euryarchaeota archaeon]